MCMYIIYIVLCTCIIEHKSIDTEIRHTVSTMFGVSATQVKTEKDVPATPAPAPQAEVGPGLVGLRRPCLM